MFPIQKQFLRQKKKMMRAGKNAFQNLDFVLNLIHEIVFILDRFNQIDVAPSGNYRRWYHNQGEILGFSRTTGNQNKIWPKF